MTRDPASDSSHESELAQLRRLRELDGLLPTLTDVLDLRKVFGRVAAIAGKVLPHDLLIVGLIDEAGEAMSVYAEAGGRPAGSPDRVPLDADTLPPEPWEHEIVADIQAETTGLARIIKAAAQSAGWHAMLRLPIRLGGRLAGTLNFHSRQTGVYGPCDLLVANRIRDHVALALSHTRLADEARRTAEVRDRAVRAEARVKALSEELAAVGGHGRVIGVSRSWKAALEQASKVAPTETTVLVTGESGTGKEVLARIIHRASPRAQGPFVAINCAALPETLLESELFGFEKGAFSGAVQAKPGLIERAAGGVLFLDEIGEMGLGVQAKLLRFLQEREFQRLGGVKTR
jgi:transcriptional regulator with GAF, ATPase, and Fis domain